MTAARRAQTSEAWTDAIPESLERAVRDYDFAATPEFQPLADLSHATELDGVSVDSNVIVVDGRRWSAPATVYVTLVYRDSANDPDPVRSGAAFPATISFDLDGDRVSVTHVDVDVRSFYE